MHCWTNWFWQKQTNKNAKRAERLKAQGARDGDIARIHAPIGLPIGAVSPSEIAVSIMAEITAQLRLPKENEAAA